MDNALFASKLESIADSIEKLAMATELGVKQENEKIAGVKQAERAVEFDVGVLGQRPSKGIDPLLDFCLS